jgi:Ala-tRNA(Pro) deacylase
MTDDPAARVGELLAGLGIPFRRFDHEPVFTCEDVARLGPAEAAGVQTKNLFLRDHRGRRHWLLVTSCEKPVDLRALAPRIGADHLSLASPDRLARLLGLTPGSVTVLGLAHDTAHEVALVVDADVWRADAWRCHPLVNTATLVLARADVERFLAATGHRPEVVEVPARAG